MALDLKLDSIAVGDGHLKFVELCPRIDEALSKYHKVKRVVMLGDYADDWGADAAKTEAELSMLEDWVAAKRMDGVEVVLLYGNHDFAYHINHVGCGTVVPAGLYVQDWQSRMRLRMCVVVNGWLLSHAGLTGEWVSENLLGRFGLGNSIEDLDVDALAAAINAMDADGDDRSKLYLAGRGRGGWDSPGPLWADKSELLRDPIPGIRQVVGHTPVPTCQVVDVSFRPKGAVSIPPICFCDTWSLTSHGKPIGDRSMAYIRSDGSILKLDGDLELTEDDMGHCIR